MSLGNCNTSRTPDQSAHPCRSAAVLIDELVRRKTPGAGARLVVLAVTHLKRCLPCKSCMSYETDLTA